MEEIIETDTLLYDIHEEVRERLFTMNKGKTEDTQVFLHSIEKVENNRVDKEKYSTPIKKYSKS